MTADDFNKIVHNRLDKCVDVLTAKAHEYAPDEDRLSNFKKAAALQSCTAPRALMGMMSKHMVALADFCNDPTHYSIEQWREKLGDNINYSLLLEALIVELLEVDIPHAKSTFCDCKFTYPGKMIPINAQGRCPKCGNEIVPM